MKGNIIFFVLFALGVTLGACGYTPSFLEESKITTYLLYALMFVIGMTLGNDQESLRGFKKLPRHLLLLPFLTIIGTTIGGTVASLVLQGDLYTTLAISAGQGYYSLSSVLLNEKLGAAVGAVALLANIFRELMTILFSPFWRKLVGPYGPIASGGATSTAAALPFIVKASGDKYLIPSVYHGIVLNISVPILVPLFAMLVN